MTLDTIYTRQDDIAFRKVSDEYVLVPLSNDIADKCRSSTTNITFAMDQQLIEEFQGVDLLIDTEIGEVFFQYINVGSQVFPVFFTAGNF